MPNFDHTGPNGDGSCAGRGMGQRMGQKMNRGCGMPRNAEKRGLDNTPQSWQGPEPETEQGAGMGRCRRQGHGQGNNNRNRNFRMNGQAAGMMQGRGSATEQGQCMPQNGQAESCATSQPAYGDGSDNKS